MDEFDNIVTFVRTVEAGSLSAAAKSFHVTPSAISKKLAKLEDQLGVVLLTRNSRNFALTDHGVEFFKTCSESLSHIKEARDSVSRYSIEAKGFLRVAIGQGFGRLYLAPLIHSFIRQNPGLSVQLLFGMQGQLFEQQVDVLISTRDPQGSNFVVRPLFPYNRITCASPSYISEHGMPDSIEDLASHNCLAFSLPNSSDHEWRFAVPGRIRKLHVNGNLTANNNDALLAAALSGLGIVHMPEYVVWPAIKRGDLIDLFPALTRDALETKRLTMNAYFPKSKNRLRKVTVFVDFLTKAFKAGIPEML
jgi:DNA-binding transcriptional LysR family regulator